MLVVSKIDMDIFHDLIGGETVQPYSKSLPSTFFFLEEVTRKYGYIFSLEQMASSSVNNTSRYIFFFKKPIGITNEYVGSIEIFGYENLPEQICLYVYRVLMEVLSSVK